MEGLHLSNSEQVYVFPEVARKMAEVLQAHLSSGEYGAVTDATNFAALPTEHLQAVSHDRRSPSPFTIRSSSPPVSQSPAPLTKKHGGSTKDLMQQINCGFQKIEILRGNIGYLKFDMVGPTCGLRPDRHRSGELPCSRRCNHF